MSSFQMSGSRLRILAVPLVAAFSVACHQLDFSPRHAQGEIDLYDDLFSVSVVDSERAVAVGYHGSVYYTTDGGESWKKGQTPHTRLLYSVSMANAQSGWAVGQLGTILRTDDGGATWTAQANLKQEEGSHLFGVHAIDPNSAWAIGEWGSRILTEDGGRTWVDHSLTISMDHPMFVWLDLRDQEKVRSGSEKVYEDVGLNYIGCLRENADKCWIVGEFGYIFYSEDRGRTWTRGEIVGEVNMDPIVLGYNEIQLPGEALPRLEAFAAEIEDENHLNVLIDPFVSAKELADFGDPEDPFALFDIVSARIDESKAVLEEAGILSDRMRMPNKPPWDYEDFIEDDPTFLTRYLEGRAAEQPMVRISVIQNPYLFTIHFQNEQEGLIAGLGGVILRSTDGGRTWTYHATSRKQALFSVATTNGRSIAVGGEGLRPGLHERRHEMGAPRGRPVPHDLHLHARPGLRLVPQGGLHRRPGRHGPAEPRRRRRLDPGAPPAGLPRRAHVLGSKSGVPALRRPRWPHGRADRRPRQWTGRRRGVQRRGRSAGPGGGRSRGLGTDLATWPGVRSTTLRPAGLARRSRMDEERDQVALARRERDLYRRLLSLGAQDELTPFLEEALALIVDVTAASQGYLELRRIDEDEPGWSLAHGCSSEELGDIRAAISRGIIAEALATGETIVTPSALTDPRFRDRASVHRARIESVLCAPIGGDPACGVLYLQGRKAPGPFDGEDRERAELFARHLAPFADRLLLLARHREDSDATERSAGSYAWRGWWGGAPRSPRRSSRPRLVAPLEVNVLLTGESGTGKSAARADHPRERTAGGRALRGVQLRDAAREGLVESELFGASSRAAHSTARRTVSRARWRRPAGARSSSTRSARSRSGDPGEAAPAPAVAQSYYPLGASEPVRRPTCASSRPPTRTSSRRCAEKPLPRGPLLPPPGAADPPALARASGRRTCRRWRRTSLDAACQRHALPASVASRPRPVARDRGGLEWPGNVRQLSHTLEAAAIRAAGEGSPLVESRHAFPGAPEDGAGASGSLTFQEATRRFQRDLLLRTLEEAEWNVTATARQLDLARSHVYNLIKAFGLERKGG